jgi:hypothetical protein
VTSRTITPHAASSSRRGRRSSSRVVVAPRSSSRRGDRHSPVTVTAKVTVIGQERGRGRKPAKATGNVSHHDFFIGDPALPRPVGFRRRGGPDAEAR